MRSSAFGTVWGWVVIVAACALLPLAIETRSPLATAAIGVAGGLGGIGAIYLVCLIVAPVRQRNEARNMLHGYRTDAASHAIVELQEFVIDRGGADLDALRCLTARDMAFGYGMTVESFRQLLAQKGVSADDSVAASVLGFMATVGVVRAERRGSGHPTFVLTELGEEVLRRSRDERRGIMLDAAQAARFG